MKGGNSRKHIHTINTPTEPPRCIHIYIYKFIHIWTYTYMHIYTYTYIHTYIYMHICMYARIHVYIYSHIHICIYTYMHVYIYAYTIWELHYSEKVDLACLPEKACDRGDLNSILWLLVYNVPYSSWKTNLLPQSVKNEGLFLCLFPWKPKKA